jgi:hypothetical protein
MALLHWLAVIACYNCLSTKRKYTCQPRVAFTSQADPGVLRGQIRVGNDTLILAVHVDDCAISVGTAKFDQ